LKKDKKIVPLRLEGPEYTVSNENDCALRLTLRDIIERLNENEKSVVVLKYFYNYTFTEISKIIELPLGTVKTLLYRSLEKLRIQLKKEDIYE
jgi:RNA polymerase sigma-70 factor (ECF subfamily)